tara:strand:- start:1959 stop:2123 length:165 start_codon:yes stop_codon:yes gene_type:complete
LIQQAIPTHSWDRQIAAFMPMNELIWMVRQQARWKKAVNEFNKQSLLQTLKVLV